MSIANSEPVKSFASPSAPFPFLRHALVYGLGGLSLQLAGIILLPIYLRYLSPSDFGIVEILERMGSLIIVLLMAKGISASAFSFYCQSEDRNQQSSVAASLCCVTCVGVALGIGFAVFAAKPLGAVFGIEDSRLTILGLSATISQLLPTVPLSLMQARTQSYAFVVSSVCQLFMRVTLVVILVASLNWGIRGVFIGTLVTNLVITAALSYLEFRRIGFHPKLATIVSIIRFQWPFVPGGLCAMVFYSSNRFFLLQYGTMDDVGLFALGSRLAAIVMTLGFNPLFKVWSARLYFTYNQPNGPSDAGVIFTRLLMPITFLGLVACLFQNEIVLILADGGFAGAATVVAPLVFAQLFLSFQHLLDGAFYFTRRTVIKLYIMIATTTIALALHALLIPQFGLLGAAVSTLLGYIVYALATFVVSRQLIPIGVEWRRLSIQTGLAVVLSLPGFFLSVGWVAATMKLAFIVLWPVLLWFSNSLSVTEKQFVRGVAAKLWSYRWFRGAEAR